jgi:putative endonuclease
VSLSPTSSARRAALSRGRAAESFVVSALQKEGWRIVTRNWRGGGGELDIVCRRGSVLRFVEVKGRRYREFEAIQFAQLKRLCSAATAYLVDEVMEYSETYFSVALVFWDGQDWELCWLEDAFDDQGEGLCRFG